MVALNELTQMGWSLTAEGFDYLLSEAEEGAKARDLADIALDTDLKLIGEGTLPENLHQAGKISGPIVLQVNKVKNISAPMINQYSQTASRMLLASLTDGKKTVQMLEFSRANSLSVDTMPGTKILIKNSIKITEGFVELEDKAIKVWVQHFSKN